MLNKEDITVDYSKEGACTITVLKGIHAGVKYVYGKVWFNVDDPENPVMNFDYDVVMGTPVYKKEFEHDIAILLHSLILEQMEAGTISYTGGEDATLEDIEELVTPLPEIPEYTGLIEDEQSSIILPGDELKFSDVIQKPGVFASKENESAMSFLDRLAAQGQAEMNKKR
jgi:hypothetical protein